MERETDYILKEVKRITAFIRGLIDTISSLNCSEIEIGIKETDDFIRKEWNLSFKEVISLNKIEFINRLNELPEVHLENLAELLSEIAKKINTTDLENLYNKKEISNKGLILMEIILEKTKTYSLKRLEIKKILKQQIYFF
tara:strand:- start:166 stop:588 length:423 start_codon:yes stop_codon:yes gene_type:complete